VTATFEDLEARLDALEVWREGGDSATALEVARLASRVALLETLAGLQALRGARAPRRGAQQALPGRPVDLEIVLHRSLTEDEGKALAEAYELLRGLGHIQIRGRRP
jgi:hypothetical protein